MRKDQLGQLYPCSLSGTFSAGRTAPEPAAKFGRMHQEVAEAMGTSLDDLLMLVR